MEIARERLPQYPKHRMSFDYGNGLIRIIIILPKPDSNRVGLTILGMYKMVFLDHVINRKPLLIQEFTNLVAEKFPEANKRELSACISSLIAQATEHETLNFKSN